MAAIAKARRRAAELEAENAALRAEIARLKRPARTATEKK